MMDSGSNLSRMNAPRGTPPQARFQGSHVTMCEADERNAKGVYRFFVAFGALAEWLIEYIVICSTQATADDLLG
jgi:hypothetical protein